MRRQDSNVRPPGYEPGELPTAPLRDITVSILSNCDCKGTTFFLIHQVFSRIFSITRMILSLININGKDSNYFAILFTLLYSPSAFGGSVVVLISMGINRQSHSVSMQVQRYRDSEIVVTPSLLVFTTTPSASNSCRCSGQCGASRPLALTTR